MRTQCFWFEFVISITLPIYRANSDIGWQRIKVQFEKHFRIQKYSLNFKECVNIEAKMTSGYFE